MSKFTINKPSFMAPRADRRAPINLGRGGSC